MPAAAFNPLVTRLNPPAIPSVLAWGRQYEGQRGPKIDMSQAVPGYPAHPMMFEALARHAGSRDSSSYGEIEGERVLRNRFAEEVSRFYGTDIVSDQIHITSGANQAFVATLLAIVAKGDRVGMTLPFYFNEEATLAMFGIGMESIACDPSAGFCPTMEGVRAALAKGVKAIVLVSPNNPTGAIYPAGLLAEIFAACRAAGAWLVLDETYRDFLPVGAPPPHELLKTPDWGDNLAILYSFSKAYCIPGHRLGAVTGSTQLVAQISKVMDNLQICAPRAAQFALAECMTALAEWRHENRVEIDRRSAAFRETFAEVRGFRICSQGAYFAFIEHDITTDDPVDVARVLAKDYGVVALPGVYFGPSLRQYMRFAFANADVETIRLLGPRLNLYRDANLK